MNTNMNTNMKNNTRLTKAQAEKKRESTNPTTYQLKSETEKEVIKQRGKMFYAQKVYSNCFVDNWMGKMDVKGLVYDLGYRL
jgi:hypothetical protein